MEIKKIIRKDKRLIWIVLGVLAIAIRFVLGYFPRVVESVYSRGVFQAVRYALNAVISFIPFPSLYLWIVVVLVIVIIFFKNIFRKHQGWTSKLYHFVVSLLAFVGAVVFFFLFLWGFNYARVPIEKQMGFEPIPLTKEEIFEELQLHTQLIIDLRNKVLKNDTTAFTKNNLPPDLETLMRSEVKKTMSNIGYPTAGPLRARSLFKGTLLRISTAGFYLPFTGECNLDAGLHPLQKPYVMAHEFSHGLGIGDEGSCNFIAYLTCRSSDDPFVKYSGTLSFWRSLAIAYLQYDNEHYQQYRSKLPPGIIADLDAINENGRLYPDIFPKFRDATYDAFLQAQGIEEGMKNYSRVILLERAWRLKQLE